MTKSLSKKRLKVGEEVMSNEDLLLEVLLRLPAKPLVRFKCVSKHWFSLISTPEFGSKHTRINPKSSIWGVYYINKYNSQLKSVSLDQANQTNIPSLAFVKRVSPSFYSVCSRIMHDCNGLLLCRYSYKSPYFVCNITTRTTTILPQHVLPSSAEYHRGNCAYLVFDPSKSPHFKVVLLDMTVSKHDTVCHYDENYQEETAYCYDLCYELDVYCSETGVWKRMFFRAPHGSPLGYYKAVCDGSLHWITKEKVHVRFEVHTLKLIFNSLPSKPTLDVEKIRYFGECCGHLFLIYIPWRSGKPFQVFELDKDHSSWKMKYRADMSLLIASFPNSFQYPEPSKQRRIPIFNWNFFVLCFVNGDEINGLSVLLAIPGKIVSYSLMKKSFKVLQYFPMKEFPLLNDYQSVYAFPFIPTLSPI